MKKYDVHVILDSKFHSVIIDCTEFKQQSGSFVFYMSGLPFAWYPIQHTVIEEHKETGSATKTGSGSFRHE